MPDPRQLDGLTVDLASPEWGGQVVASSDAYYSSPEMLIRPDRAVRRARLGKLDGVATLAMSGCCSNSVVWERFVDSLLMRATLGTRPLAQLLSMGVIRSQFPSVESTVWVPLLVSDRNFSPTRVTSSKSQAINQSDGFDSMLLLMGVFRG